MTKPHEYYMSQALELAREAADAGEVPVGCVIVRDGALIEFFVLHRRLLPKNRKSPIPLLLHGRHLLRPWVRMCYISPIQISQINR